MNLIDRFTRDRVSKVVWSLAFITLAGLFAASFVMESRESDTELERAGDRAKRHVQLLAQELTTFSLGTELDGDALAAAQAQADRILADPRVSAVRIWNTEADPMLVFSTAAGDPVGSREAENDELLARAAAGGGAPHNVVSGEGDGAALHTYALIPDAIAEIEQDRALVLADVDATWGSAKTVTAIAAGVMLLLTFLSFRPAVASVGAGVPFVKESVPAGMTLIDTDRLAAVNDVYALAQQRVDKLKERLQLAENERLFLQGELQRALSGFAPSPEAIGQRPTAPAPTPEAPARRPEPAKQETRPEPARPAKKKKKAKPERTFEEAPAASIAERPEEADEPTPDAAEILAAAAEVGEVVDASSKPKPEPATPEPEIVEIPEPEVASIPEPEVVSLPESEVVAAQPTEREAASVGAWSYPSVPEVAALREDPLEEARDARELLDRLMATERHEIGGPDADPGRIREQIARVAAKKKPGGGEAKKLFTEPERPKPPWMRDRES